MYGQGHMVLMGSHTYLLTGLSNALGKEFMYYSVYFPL